MWIPDRQQGVTIADSVETLGVDESQKVGRERKNEEEVQGDILAHKEEERISRICFLKGVSRSCYVRV